MQAIKTRKFFFASVIGVIVEVTAKIKINEFDRGNINIQLGVNVMATRAPALFHYVQKSK